MWTPSWRMQMSNALSRVEKNGLPLNCVILEDTELELEALGYFPDSVQLDGSAILLDP